MDGLHAQPLLESTPEATCEDRLFSYFKGYTLSERTKETRSWIWRFGYDIQNATERRWVCRACIKQNRPQPTSIKSVGIQNAMEHIFLIHQIRAPAGEKTKSAAERKAEAQAASSSDGPGGRHRSISQHFGLDTAKPREQAIANSFIKEFDRDHFQRLIVQWIVNTNRPFTDAEDRDLRTIFEYLNPSVALRKAHVTGDSIRNKIIAEYCQHRDTIIGVLRRCPGLVHISFDGWTARNRQSLYGMACFFRDEQNRPLKIVLGLSEISERHTGENIAAEVFAVIDLFGIRDKVGYATLDNAANNDTAMDTLGELLGFNGKRRRVRCFGHALNLAAKALLFGKCADAIELDDPFSGASVVSDAEWAGWLKKGPVGASMPEILVPFAQMI